MYAFRIRGFSVMCYILKYCTNNKHRLFWYDWENDKKIKYEVPQTNYTCYE